MSCPLSFYSLMAICMKLVTFLPQTPGSRFLFRRPYRPLLLIRPWAGLLLLLVFCPLTHAQDAGDEYHWKRDIPYRTEADATDYMRERCKIDLYYPSKPNYATVVWFHGGGLKAGKKKAP